MLGITLLVLFAKLVCSFDFNLLAVDNNLCGDNRDWIPVNLQTIIGPSARNEKVIKASFDSCLTIPIKYTTKDVLVVSAYIKGDSSFSGVTVLLFDSNDDYPILNYVYDSDNEDFISGWIEILLHIDLETVDGYVTLLGHSENDDIVIIESLRYMPYDFEGTSNSTVKLLVKQKSIEVDTEDETFITHRQRLNNVDNDYNEHQNVRVVAEDNYDENLRIIDFNDDETEENTSDALSTTTESEGTETTNLDTTLDPDTTDQTPGPSEPESNRSFWTSWMGITIIVVVSVTIVALASCSAYYIGKRMGNKEVPIQTLDDFEDPEAPRVIPRVHMSNVYPDYPSERPSTSRTPNRPNDFYRI